MPKWTDAQLQAMHLHGMDILVSAAAGSGKTATLTERIIRSLTHEPTPDHPRGNISRMLIVTFTRAAAAELRARISAALSRAIAEHPDDRYLYNQLIALGSAQICTIDAFYQQPVRENFERLGLPCSFRLADEAELTPMKVRLLDRLIDEHYAAAADQSRTPASPLEALEGNAFVQAMDDLLPRRDTGALAGDLLSLFEKLLAFPQGVELLKQSADRLSAQSELPFSQTQEGKILTDALCQTLSYYAEAMQNACATLATDPQTEQKYLPAFTHDFETINSVLLRLQTKDWAGAQSVLSEYVPLHLKKISSTQDVPFDLTPIKEIRSEATAALKDIKEEYFSDSPEQMQEQMLRTARTQYMLYVLLSDYDREIRKEKIRRGVLDFSDVRRYLLELLVDDRGMPTQTAHALSKRYDAIYIDEYQDVDTVQDTIFSVIGEKKRFMVGDIKQSIYGFRGAEPSIFSDYRKRFLPADAASQAAHSQDGRCVFMSENFRCDPCVIDFTNAVCAYTFRACPDSLDYRKQDDLLCGKNPPSEQYQSPPVELVLLEKSGPASQDNTSGLSPEAIYTAREISRLLQQEKRADGKPLRPSDIAILVRSATMVNDLIRALRAYGIEGAHPARDHLATHPDMTLMVNLLSVIDNPHDDVPLMGLFSAQGSPISLADVLLARRDKQHARSLYEDLCAATTDPDVAWDERKRQLVSSFQSKVEAWRTLAITLPIDRLLRQLYQEPFLRPLSNSPALLCLYDYARNYQNTAFCGLYQFLQYFRQVLSGNDALAAGGLQRGEEAVNIMTIHGSKGLEFPVVFLCGCAKSFNTKDTRSSILFDAAFGAAARIYHAQDGSQSETVTRRAIAHSILERQTEEEMRLLYVALTRARERLYLTAALTSTADKRLSKANRPTQGKRTAILSATCYLDWVLSALSPANAQGKTDFVHLTVADRADYLTLPCDITQGEATAPMQSPPSQDEVFYRSILERHQDFVDPHAAARYLPTKAAASKLHKAMLDGTWLPEEFGGDANGDKEWGDLFGAVDMQDYVRQRIELMQSVQQPFHDLMKNEKGATAAERGSATHLFLQHCSFSRLATTSPEQEIDTLVDLGLLPRQCASLLHRGQLELFKNSDLFALLSEPRIKLWRELRFDRFLPYDRLTRNADLAEKIKDYRLYVQGSLDLVVEQEDGTLWLCDYKTDRMVDTEDAAIKQQLSDAHGDQLRIYAEAVEGLFGRRPDRIVIYSLPLGRTVDLTDRISS